MLDLGMVARLKPEESQAFIGFLQAVGAGDGARAGRRVLAFSEDQTCVTPKAFCAAMDAFFLESCRGCTPRLAPCLPTPMTPMTPMTDPPTHSHDLHASGEMLLSFSSCPRRVTSALHRGSSLSREQTAPASTLARCSAASLGWCAHSHPAAPL